MIKSLLRYVHSLAVVSFFSLNSFAYSDGARPMTAATTPLVQASNVMVTNITSASATISWTKGDGSYSLVAIRDVEAGVFTPTDGTGYSSHSEYRSMVYNSWSLVYNSTGSGVTITNLLPATTYRVMVKEYNGTSGEQKYLNTINATNSIKFVTPATPVSAQTGQWTFTGGSNYNAQQPVFGTQGASAIGNTPGARYGVGSGKWIDDQGNMWLFGGAVLISGSTNGYMNDLWKYDNVTRQWTWLKGSNNVNQNGTYGVKGVASANNLPGSREFPQTWTDKQGNLWMMGGHGNAAAGASEFLNDVWKYDIGTNQWTWMSGSDQANQYTVVGSKGVPSVDNRPNSRYNSTGWTDANGDLWLMGGYSTTGYLNDLWKYSIATGQWTWVNGSISGQPIGSYGTKAISSASNTPGGRIGSVSWVDKQGYFWLCGGQGYSASSFGFLNDLWKLDPTTGQWVWISGGTLVNQSGTYGTKGQPSVANVPSTRYDAMGWTDNAGNLWLTGGSGYASSGVSGYLNDLWKYDVSANQWTWVNGSNSTNVAGVYGTTGVPSATNMPGSRFCAGAWQDKQGNFVMLGGFGYSASGSGFLSDMWIYKPFSTLISQASNIVFTNTTKNGTTIGWTNGSGTERVVFVKEGEIGLPATVDNSTYESNAKFRDGAQISSSGWFAVYKGAGSSVTVTGLDPGTSYIAVVVEYNKDGSYITYGDITGTSGNPAVVVTTPTNIEVAAGQWTWAGGSDQIQREAVYGTQNIAAPGNIPGARQGAAEWTDNQGNLWLMGGSGSTGESSINSMNDLWKFDITTRQWAFKKGSGIFNSISNYGTKGVASATAMPGARQYAQTWTDGQGNLWLMGGLGYAASGFGSMNDLWKYDIESGRWTWVGGSTTLDQITVVIGSSSATIMPGSRYRSVGWADTQGNLWLMGGTGMANSGSSFYNLSDLWRYNVATGIWTWMSGSVSSVGQNGTYGTKGVSVGSNRPGGRYGAVSWWGKDDDLWLMGGYGYGASALGYLNDVWRYNITSAQWTWMGGSDQLNQVGSYGTQGQASASTSPGGRIDAAGWADRSGNLWLFGGSGYLSSSSLGNLADLWKFDIVSKQWTWIKGDASSQAAGVYGNMGQPADNVRPGSRVASTSWKDKSGDFWLMGGQGYASTSTTGYLNDLWVYRSSDAPFLDAPSLQAGNITFTNTTKDQTTISWTNGSGTERVVFVKEGETGLPVTQDDKIYDGKAIFKEGTQIPSAKWYAVYSGTGSSVNVTGLNAGTSYVVAVVEYKKDGTAIAYGNLNGASGNPAKLVTTPAAISIVAGQWTWAGGSDRNGQLPVYGTKGIAAVGNTPGARRGAAKWTDSQGNLWLMGGLAFLNETITGYVNDLWKYDSNTRQWTLIRSGSTASVYGTKGIGSSANTPGTRQSPQTWTDNNGDLWLMGGFNVTNSSYLNDLWKYDISNDQWTWIGGSNLINQASVGSKGVTSASAMPSARYFSTGWTDAQGDLWLMGGYGFMDPGNTAYLNDLWKYNIVTGYWTWVSGITSSGQYGVYGTTGVSATNNVPGGRFSAASSIDKLGNVWLFGGYGYGATATSYLNDVWKYNPSSNQWTWVGGSSGINQIGNFGTKGSAAATNTPGSRFQSFNWIDNSGDLWLFGGYGYGSTTSPNSLNDLWKFSTSTNQWTWVGGSSTTLTAGIYGSAGTPAATNAPGARYDAPSWVDKQGNLVMMGGAGTSASGTGQLSDLWIYKPFATPATQASNVTFTNTTADQTTISWTNGGGTERVVFVKDATTTLPAPVSDVAYAGNTVYRSGAQIGTTGWYAVYSGTGSSVTLTGLNPGTTYTAAVIEYNKSGSSVLYSTLTGATGNPAKTVTTAPTITIKEGQWTWAGGSDDVVKPSVYGTQGIAAVGNVPGARGGPAKWTDKQGNLWLMGGFVGNGGGYAGPLGDLWKYDMVTKLWTWMKGATISGNSAGVYGTKGIQDVKNYPAARQHAQTWVDHNGDLWLFGGNGQTSLGSVYLNDLWRYNIETNQWAWMGGSSAVNQNTIATNKGVPSATAAPGARYKSVGWTDAQGDLWLFGGVGLITSGQTVPLLNDLWKYDVTNGQWAWINGSVTSTQTGIYGTKGLADINNIPGGRIEATAWVDKQGKFWLYGGYGNGIKYSGFQNDLWKYDPLTGKWTWMRGRNDAINYSLNQPADGPDSRVLSMGWTDNAGDLWLFGGGGFSNGSVANAIKELWRYSVSTNEWKWISGTQTPSPVGIYGTMGVPSVNTTPGSRSDGAAWIDNDGNFWLMGGNGASATFANGNYGYLNDLWVYKPETGPTTQASDLTFSEVKLTSAKLAWTNGNGTARAVFIKATTSGSAAPANGVTYTAGNEFSTGTQIGTTGWYNVYNGTGNTADITGLTPGTTYRAMVIEYNGEAGAQLYNTIGATGNPVNVTTPPVLALITPGLGTLAPAFDPTVLTYDVLLPQSQTGSTMVGITAKALQPGSAITINNIAVSSDAELKIKATDGRNFIPVTVTLNGLTTTYTVRVMVGKVRSVVTLPPFAVKTYGDADFNAGATSDAPAIPIVYTSSNTAAATVNSDGKITITGGGTTLITARQMGNTDYASSNALSQTLTIQKATVKVAAIDVTRIYGDANPVFRFKYTGFLNGETETAFAKPTAATTAGKSSAVGIYDITSNVSALRSYKYDFVSEVGKLTITPAALAIRANAVKVVYGSVPVFTATYTGFKNGDNVTKLTTPPVFAGVTPAGNAGSYPITVSGATSPNYTITYSGNTAVISKAPLKIMADNKSKQKGDVNPMLTMSYTGFKNGDDQDVLGFTPLLSTTAVTNSNPGNYPIRITGYTSSANYNITYAYGTLIVTNVIPLRMASLAQTPVAGEEDPTDGITVHQGLSPNGDGQNDNLLIEGIERYTNKVSIYNASGAQIAQVTNYDNGSRVFDGRHNGILQPDGTYFYVIEYVKESQTKRLSGYIIIKR